MACSRVGGLLVKSCSLTRMILSLMERPWRSAWEDFWTAETIMPDLLPPERRMPSWFCFMKFIERIGLEEEE